MFYKTIIQGKLDFGNQKSYEKVIKMFQYKIETYYKNDFIFKLEDIFFEESLTLNVPRFVGNITEKSYKATADLLNYCSQFAINGILRTWLLDNGDILHFSHIEPESDKAAVQLYMKGKKLVKEQGKQEEAIEELSKAIEKYDRHALAYERRAKVCFLLQKYTDAMRDYNKSISIDPSIPSSFYGRARVHLHNGNLAEAIEDFDTAIKKSVALETIHWKARRLKALTHLKNDEMEKAIYELKLFTARKFKKNDPNIVWRRIALFHYGKCMLAKDQYTDAIMAFDEAAELPESNDGVDVAELLNLRAETKRKAGKNGFVKDLKEAAKLGNLRASKLLKELV